MITTQTQAVAVQSRRHKEGKRGFAKAVRRFFNRGLNGKQRLPNYAKDFPVIWAKPAKAAQPPRQRGI